MKANQSIDPLKIALFGYGKMGRLVDAVATAQGHHVCVRATQKTTYPDLSQVEVCLDVSHPAAVYKHVEWAAKAGKNIVIGTTGWENAYEKVRDLVEAHGIAMLYAPNLSLGFFYFKQIVCLAHQLMQDRFDCVLTETHHRTKVDRPSGSAKYLADLLQLPPENVVPIRCGHHPGEYTVLFDDPSETITLAHATRNREGYVQGALVALDWLRDKKGCYTLDDLFQKI